MFWKLLKFNSDDLWLYLGAEGGLFLLIHLVAAAILFFTKETAGFLFSGVVMPVVASAVALIAAVAQMGVNFDIALRFGQTRRRALGQAMGVIVTHGAFSMALAGLLVWLERLLAPALWVALTGAQGVLVNYHGDHSALSGWLLISSIELDWWWYPLLLAIGIGAGLILGAVMQRFGGKGGFVIWAIVMLPTFGFQLLPWERFTTVDWLIPLLAVLALAGLIWSVWSLLHASVKG